MQIRRAQAMGFCFGVRDALEAALALDALEPTAIYGELVHNEAVQARLDEKGLQTLGEAARREASLPRRVMITAHGISNRERERLQTAGHELVDTTCPLVTRAHDAALKLAAEGRFVIVLGRQGHVEVQGLTGDLTAVAVVSSDAEVRDFGAEKLGIISQTTMTVAEAQRLIDLIRAANPSADIKVKDTICEPTKQRQRAITALARECDFVVVVGGARSNNAQELVRTCQALGTRAERVTSPEDLRPEWFEGIKVCGLTVGTSTPDTLIDAVEAALQSLDRPSRLSRDAPHPRNHA